MKKIIALLLSFILIISLCSCQKNPTEEELLKRIEELEKQLAEQNSNKESDIGMSENNADNKISVNSEESEQEPKSNTETFVNVNFGDVITLDFVEITIDSASCSQCIYPTDTSSVYSYKADQENEQYWYLIGSIKNIGTDGYDIEDIVAEFCFDDKYTYNAWLIADDGGYDFYNSFVKPFGTVKYYIFSSIPDELINMYSTCTVKFGFKENFSGSYYDDFDECDYLYQITVKK